MNKNIARLALNCVILIFINSSLFSQDETKNSFGAFIEVGPSWIHGEWDTHPKNLILSLHAQPTSARAGLFFSRPINENFCFGTKIVLSTVAARLDFIRSESYNTYTEPGSLFFRAYSLGLNPYGSYKYKKITLHGGFQFQYFAAASYIFKDTETYITGNGTIITQNSTVEKDGGLLLNAFSFDLSSTFGIEYSITNRISLEINYCHGYNNVLRAFVEQSSEIVVKTRQLTLGVKFSIF